MNRKKKSRYKDYYEINQFPEYEREDYNQIKVHNRYNNKYIQNNINYSFYEILLMIIIILSVLFCIICFLKSFKDIRVFNKNQIYSYNTNNENQTQINISIYTNETNTSDIIVEEVILENKTSNITNEIENYIENITDNITETENKKLSIAFIYSTLFANGIARFVTLTANYFVETGKYDVYLITGKSYSKDYKYNSKIKRVYAYNNQTLLRNFTKHVNIDFFILHNVLGKGTVDFYKKLGKKVICIFHGVYMSAMFHGYVSSYKNWIQFDYYDAFIFISYDDYYFYKKLGYKNAIFIPNLYTFEPSKIQSSNLETHNILMLGRAADKVKGFIYAVKTLPFIVKEVPDAILNIVSSNYNVGFLKDLATTLNVSNNLIINYYTENITKLFWKSSVLMYTSLSEAFPMAMNEAKAHGLPIVAFNVQYSIPYQSGVINVDMLDCEALANETIKLLKDYDYRKKMGEEAKLSLNQFSNNETVELWGRLFNSLLEGEDSYRRLQDEIEKKYYNEERAREHMEKHYEDLLRLNKNFTCHIIKNFTDINYIKNIEMCPFIPNSTEEINEVGMTDIQLGLDLN